MTFGVSCSFQLRTGLRLLRLVGGLGDGKPHFRQFLQSASRTQKTRVVDPPIHSEAIEFQRFSRQCDFSRQGSCMLQQRFSSATNPD